MSAFIRCIILNGNVVYVSDYKNNTQHGDGCVCLCVFIEDDIGCD
jgi:hypothetical protein